MTASVCPNCGQPNARKSELRNYHYVECGLDNVWLANGVTRTECAACGERHIHVYREPQLLQVIARDLIMTRSQLSGLELRYVRRASGLSQEALAGMLRTRRETIAERESKADPKLGRAEAIGIRLVLLKSFLDFLGKGGNNSLTRRQRDALDRFAHEYCSRVIEGAEKSVHELRFQRGNSGKGRDWEPEVKLAA
jgi:transcriptional regulator with XRE-family HTH domain